MRQKIILIAGMAIVCQFRRNVLSRQLRITVHPDKRVRVTLPVSVSLKAAERFVLKNTRWIIQTIDALSKQPSGMLRSCDPQEYRLFKEKARIIVQQRIQVYNQFYHVPIGRVSIRNQRSRWGSCSSQGNLNFNYKIFFLSSDLQDYLIVHEMCHLKEMNHSSRFWAHVGQTIPNCRELSRKLRSL